MDVPLLMLYHNCHHYLLVVSHYPWSQRKISGIVSYLAYVIVLTTNKILQNSDYSYVLSTIFGIQHQTGNIMTIMNTVNDCSFFHKKFVSKDIGK